MKVIISLFLLMVVLASCKPAIHKLGQNYQQTGDIESLKKVVSQIAIGSDTAFVKNILGEPIDMGFDYRYLTELTGENNCVIGAVFHLDEFGKVDDKWVGEICE